CALLPRRYLTGSERGVRGDRGVLRQAFGEVTNPSLRAKRAIQSFRPARTGLLRRFAPRNDEPREDEMQHVIQRSLAVAGFALMCAAFPAQAQENVRLRSTIAKVDGPVYTVKNRDGTEWKLTVSDPPLFVAIAPATMADIKPGMFVGSAGMMRDDGVQKAIEVHIFPESMRGTG